MTISYRMLAAIVGVVLVFGVAAAFLVGDDDDGDSASDTTVPIDRNDDGGVKTEDDEDDEDASSTTATTRATTTSTTAPGTTTTAAGSGATTSTTRASGGGTTTTRPRSTTTAPPTTTAPTNPPPTNPPPTNPPTTATSADLGIHTNSTATDFGRRVTVSIENSGPARDVDFTLTTNGDGAPVRAVEAGSGFTCNRGGSSVTCTARGVGEGGTVRQVTIDYEVDAACTGQPAFTANVSSSNRTDPNTSDNNYVRSLCRDAPNN